MPLQTFSVEQMEQKRKRRLERKANRHVPRGDLGHYLLPTLTRVLYKQGNISQKIADNSTIGTMDVTNLLGTFNMDRSTIRSSIDMSRGIDIHRPQTSAPFNAAPSAPASANPSRRTSHTVDFESSLKAGQSTRRPLTAARRDSNNHVDFETSFRGGLSPNGIRRPQTAGGNEKKKKEKKYFSTETDIAHVSCDLEKIRKKALKDFKESWHAADHLLLPSVRSQMTIQLLEEDPIRFHPKELDNVSIRFLFISLP